MLVLRRSLLDENSPNQSDHRVVKVPGFFGYHSFPVRSLYCFIQAMRWLIPLFAKLVRLVAESTQLGLDQLHPFTTFSNSIPLGWRQPEWVWRMWRMGTNVLLSIRFSIVDFDRFFSQATLPVLRGSPQIAEYWLNENSHWVLPSMIVPQYYQVHISSDFGEVLLFLYCIHGSRL